LIAEVELYLIVFGIVKNILRLKKSIGSISPESSPLDLYFFLKGGTRSSRYASSPYSSQGPKLSSQFFFPSSTSSSPELH